MGRTAGIYSSSLTRRAWTRRRWRRRRIALAARVTALSTTLAVFAAFAAVAERVVG